MIKSLLLGPALLLAPLALLAQSAAGPARGPARVPAPVAAPERPALVVLITIDQFRADYLDRFRSQLTGGLGRMLRQGAVFTDAHQDHAITETAPGHASLLSGRFPRSTGIMLNSIGVDDASAPLIEGGVGPGASPLRFQGTTFADWLRSSNRDTRVLSVSMKDRGAILPIGRSKSDVYWYSPDSRFVTSSYYASALPPWVKAFNARHLPQRYAGTSWTLLLPDSSYAERDSVSIEGAGRDFTFPHPLPDDSANAGSLVRATPFMDDLTLAFALAGLDEKGLGSDRGTRPRTDLLAISLSATDVIGHRFGPDSREIHDQVVRVDRAIGRFIDSLFVLRDSSRVLIVLTADHGVGTIPELAAATVPTPSPMPDRVELYSLLPETHGKLHAAGVDTNALDIDGGIILLDRKAFAKSALSPDTLLAWFAASARNIPGVLRVDRFQQLLADTLSDPIARRWAHQFPRAARIELIATLHPLSTWGGNVASHGSPHPYDSHVPLIFMGADIAPGTHGNFVRTVDIAPTLANLVGVTPAETLDGVPLSVRR